MPDFVQHGLITTLHDLGVIVHFADFELEDMHVLEPRWLTGAVYRIINSDELADDKGRVHLRSSAKKGFLEGIRELRVSREKVAVPAFECETTRVDRAELERMVFRAVQRFS